MTKRDEMKVITLCADAKSPEEFYSALRAIDISVPKRGECTHDERKTQAEIWTVFRLLSSLTRANRVTFPITVIKRDRPDFYVRFATTEVGIEASEITDEKYSKYLTLAAEEFPEAIHDPGLFRPGNPNLSKDQMRVLLKEASQPRARLMSKPWVGDSAEAEWADYVVSRVESKLGALARKGFESFQQNWLSMYGNAPPPNIDVEVAMRLLLPRLEGFWTKNPSFDALYVEEGETIIQITATGWEQIGLDDIWRSRQ